jgi:hypothetical protein
MTSTRGSSEPLSLAFRRTRRAFGIASIALGCAGFAHAADWPQFQRGASHPGSAIASAITPENVGTLHLAWKDDFGADASSEGGAAMAGSNLFVTGFDGRLSAFDIDGCGADRCQPLWQGAADGDITSTPAVSAGRVVFASADHFLHVFDAKGCGSAQCAALWRGQLSDASIDSSVAIAGGMIFVGDFGGRLSVFPLAGCGQAVCEPAWTAQADQPNEQMNSAPAVGAGFVFVQTSIATFESATGRLLAFPADGCGHATCDPVWTADLGGPAGFTSAPVVAGDKVIVGSSARIGNVNGKQHVFAFDAGGCGKKVCKPVQFFEAGPEGIVTTPAVSGSTLFLSTNKSPGNATVGVVAAYDLATCGVHCKPSWTGVNHASGAFSPPAVVGDLVFVGKGPASVGLIDAGVYAFDARGCGRIQCEPLAFVQSSQVATYFGAPLAIARDRIAFVSNDATTLASSVSVITLP